MSGRIRMDMRPNSLINICQYLFSGLVMLYLLYTLFGFVIVLFNEILQSTMFQGLFFYLLLSKALFHCEFLKELSMIPKEKGS